MSIDKYCLKVLKYTKEHKRNITEEEFGRICCSETDAVLAELKKRRIGTYVIGHKSIWNIDNETLEYGLSYYMNKRKTYIRAQWMWIIGISISILGIIISAFLT